MNNKSFLPRKAEPESFVYPAQMCTTLYVGLFIYLAPGESWFIMLFFPYETLVSYLFSVRYLRLIIYRCITAVSLVTYLVENTIDKIL